LVDPFLEEALDQLLAVGEVSVGGALTQLVDWRATMYVNLVFAAVAVSGAIVLLGHERALRRTKLDVPGPVAASGGLFALVLGFSNAETTSWDDPP
jgi:hypothetical protein